MLIFAPVEMYVHYFSTNINLYEVKKSQLLLTTELKLEKIRNRKEKIINQGNLFIYSERKATQSNSIKPGL